jgi:hypothetical protein
MQQKRTMKTVIEELRSASLTAAVLAIACAASGSAANNRGHVLFSDDFERALDGWTLIGRRFVLTEPTIDPHHGRVLALEPGGDVLALIRGSERWGAVRLDADVLFPTSDDSYLGVVYNFSERERRRDFGVIYIKGNDSYLQANPHRDSNPGRLLYPEHHVELAGDAAIQIGRWQRLTMEVRGRTAHFYVSGGRVPQLTFSHFEREAGAVGLKPRVVGAPVWIDNVVVTRIAEPSYSGEPRPARAYAPEKLLTTWEVFGPLDRNDDAAVDGSSPSRANWRPFSTDARGAVVTASVVDYHGPKSAAYFRTTWSAERAGSAFLQISTVDDLALWVNGRFHGFVPRKGPAWFDFWSNPAHAGQRIPVELKAGANQFVVRVRGGVYASGGFFARVEQ